MDMKKIVDAKIFNNIKELIPLIVNKALFLFKVKSSYNHLIGWEKSILKMILPIFSFFIQISCTFDNKILVQIKLIRFISNLKFYFSFNPILKKISSYSFI
jgi:hypothetical protein